jgi:hypothetical protein
MSKSPLLLKYPIDRTGKSPTNLVINEPHIIGESSKRAFVPNCGPFYTASAKVVDVRTGETLKPREQYLILQPYQEASIETGLDVASVVYITDPSVSTDILFTYQVVGGEFSWSVYALEEMLQSLNLDNRPVKWGDIIGRPSQFPPTPHLHDLGDSYGWEYIGVQLEGIRSAILTGDAASHDELRQQFIYMVDQVRALLDGIEQQIVDHRNDKNNPHIVTKVQIGMDLVENFGIATDSEATAGVVKNKYMTPYLTSLQATRISGETMGAHTGDKNNPHVVTKVQIGLGSVDDYQTATTAEGNAGVATNRFMTPAVTKSAITTFAVDPLNAHVANVNNPHGVTKAQVGLSNVDNYATASSAQATTAAAHNQTVTGEQFVIITGLNAAFRQYHTAAVTPHLVATNNPHAVTKAQVGLGNVDNYLTATTVEAEDGTATNRFMTPALTKAAVNKFSADMLVSHTGDRNNPHVVTKAQVGLGSVDNYSTATTVEATAAGAHNQTVTGNKFIVIAGLNGAFRQFYTDAVTPHITSTSNPHAVTKSQVGLGSVDNYATASQAQAEGGTLNTVFMTPLRTKQAIDVFVTPTLNTHTAARNNPHVVTAAQVGAYTTAQTDSALALKLGKTETAVNSSKLENLTKQQVVDEAYNRVGSNGKRDLFTATRDPLSTEGVVGDVWYKY